jgi:N-acetylmuramoyl-L-alanine amidase
MPKLHTIALGECIGSLTRDARFGDYKRIHDDGANSRLKTARPNPNVLAEGDAVSIPDPNPKEVDKAADARHIFKIKMQTALLRIVVQDETDTAISGKKYRLTVEGKTFEGKTPADGKIEHPINGIERTGTLELWLSDDAGIDPLVFPLEVGSLEHESKDRACQARLLNLGFDCGGTGGRIDDQTRDALRGFQAKNGMAVNGVLDAAVRNKLRAAHEGG